MVHWKKGISIVIKTITIPLLIFLFFEILDRLVVGMGVINTSADIKMLLRNLVSSYAFALAINANLGAGRMDLSIGGQMYVGVIFGGVLAIDLGLGGVGMLVLAMLIGGLCGVIVGVLFVNLRILPMILGIGMTLIFECMSFSVNNQQGVTIYGKEGFSILSDSAFVIGVIIVILLVMTILYEYSSFGYKLKAIQGNQGLAHNNGINIYINCIICYFVAGILTGCAGVFEAAFKGSLTPVLGMESNSVVFNNFFPMLLGAWIGTFSRNQTLGILMGSLSVRVMIIGMSRLRLGTTTQNIIVYVLLLLFVIFNTNKGKIAYIRVKRKRIAEAKRMREAKI